MDPISDLLTRIRNANMAGQEKADIPHSNVKEGILHVLKNNGLIKNFRVVKDNKQGIIRVYLKYTEKGKPVINNLKRESRPGLRKYVPVDKIPQVRTGFGLAILSTNQGIMSGEEAKEKKVGGEYICSVW
ncbi:MAG: 30S ribosomal protein S8 [Oligoflexia bacterium]|nr:30S ribosomal protein S8 [Oligoflexia bacterium]